MDEINQLSFEAAFSQLEKTLAQLESDALPLERALALYQRGGKLAQRCQSLLDEAEQRLEILDHESRPAAKAEDGPEMPPAASEDELLY